MAGKFSIPVQRPVKRAALFLAVLSFCFSLSLSAQDSSSARQMIEILSSGAMHGRSLAYDGERKAAEQIRSLLQEAGVKAVGENYFQPYPLPGFAMEGSVSLALDQRELNPFDDYRIHPFSLSLDAAGIPILPVDPILLIDKNQRDKFLQKQGEKMRNAFLYFDISQLDNIKDPHSREGIQLAIHQLGMDRDNALFGAAGYLIGDTRLPAIGLSGTNYPRPFAFIHLLADRMKGTKTLSVSYSNRFISHGESRNVAGLIEGTAHPDSFIVFTAHFDHIGCMGEEVVFPGAHDNASGVATVLSLARYFSRNPLPYSILFCFFSGEEAGLRGSRYFVENPLVPLDKIRMLLNVDMLCGGDEGIMVVNSQSGLPSVFYGELKALNEKKKYLPSIQSRANARNSDHFPFTEKGVPALFIYTLGGPHGGYHEYTDTASACGLSSWENIFRLIVEWTETVAGKLQTDDSK